MPGVQIAALQRIAVAERGLQIGDLAAVGQPFDGLDRCAVRLHRQHQAGTHDLAVHAHRAGAANPMLAADMSTGQLQMLAQEIRQIEPRQHVRIDALAIDVKRNRHERPSRRSSRAEIGTAEQRGHAARQQHLCQDAGASPETPADLPGIEFFVKRCASLRQAPPA